MYKTLTSIILIILSATMLYSAEYNVNKFGAVADGKKDCTASFQKAIDTAYKAGGGKVKVPSGTYMIKGTLNLRYNVTLSGEYIAPPAPTIFDIKTKEITTTTLDKNKILTGTVLLAVNGEGKENGTPFISMERNATLSGIVIYYPNQVYTKTPIAYPWTVRGSGDNISILDCLFVNPYMAVDFGTNPAGRHLIRNLYAQAIYKGIFIDKCYDVGRIENVHLWPFWSAHMLNGKSQFLDDWMLKNATAFIFSRGDWEYVSNSFAISYYQGFHFKSSAPDGPGNYLLSQSGADGCDIAVHVEETQGHSGISFVNSQLFGRILIDKTNGGPVRFTSCGLFGGQVVHDPFDKEVVSVDGHGVVTLNSCHLYAINGKTNAESYIRQNGGQLIVNSCVFMMNSFLDPIPLIIEENANSTIFTSNTLWTQKKVINNKGESGRIIIKDNVFGDTQ